MRFSINIPNFGDFADPRTVATVAAAAEQAGWDGLWLQRLDRFAQVIERTKGAQ